MATQNIMAVSTQPASAKSADNSSKSLKSAKSSLKASTGKGSFAAAMSDADAKDVSSYDSQNSGSLGGNDSSDSGSDAMQQSMAGAAAVTNQQPAQKAQADTGKGNDETVAAVVELSTKPETTAQAASQTQTEEPAQSSKTVQADLMSLIPQDAQENAKGQDFLAMLSGQPMKTAATDAAAALRQSQPAAGAQAQTAATAGTVKIVTHQPTVSASTTPLEAALSSTAQTQTAAQAQTQTQPAAQQGAAQTMSALFGQTVVTKETAQTDPLTAMLQTAQTQQPAVAQTATETVAAVQTPVVAVVADTADTQPAVQTKTDTAPTPAVTTDVLAVTGTTDATAAAFQQASDDAPQQGNPSQQRNAAQTAPQPAVSSTEDAQAPRTVGNVAEPAPAPATSTDQPVPTQGAATFQQTLTNLTSTSSASTQAAQQPQQTYDIQQQIVDQARLIQRNQDTEMVIHLKPEHLGDLTLKVSVTQNGSVNASFHSPNAEVRTIIENSLVQLRQDLNNQGIKVDNVDVYAGLGNELPQSDGGASYQNQQQGQKSHRRVSFDEGDYEDDLGALTAASDMPEAAAASDGVDYRI